MELHADWTFSSKHCAKYVSEKISSMKFSLTNEANEETPILEETREDGYVCVIEKLSLPVGKYDAGF